MKYLAAFLCAILLVLAHAQDPTHDDVRMPDGKLQANEILKFEHERNLRDAAELARLSAEIRDDFEKGDAHVLSVKTLNKLDDVEKLAKNIRGRLRRN
jgi:hypothetical protein